MKHRTHFGNVVADLAEEFRLSEYAKQEIENELHHALVAGQEGAVCRCRWCLSGPGDGRREGTGLVTRPGLVRWIRHRADAEKGAATQLALGGAEPDAVAFHRGRAEAFLDLAAWIDGHMDRGKLPKIERDDLASLFSQHKR